jgi:uncharacterized protein YkwD
VRSRILSLFSTRLLRFGLVIPAAATLLVSAATTAGAATPTASLSATSGLPNTRLTVRASGLPISTRAWLAWDGSTSGLPHPWVGSTGSFATSMLVPASAAPGNHTLTIRDGSVSLQLAFRVTSSAPATTPTPSPTSPTVGPTSTPTALPTSTAATPQARVVQLVNQARAQAGLSPLVVNTNLGSAAQSYSALMASTNCFGHTCGPVPDFSQRLVQAGYTGWTALGENVAAGQQTADDVFTSWMNSPGHKANILNSSFREIGVGMAKGGSYGVYWTQEFGAR